MSRRPLPPALYPQAAALIRAALTRDAFAVDRIVTRAFESDVDGIYFAVEVAYLTGALLGQACGSKAQAVAVVDALLEGVVRDQVRAASLESGVDCL
jgi:hypothetical protein